MSQKEMHNFDLATNPVLFGFPEISKFVIKILHFSKKLHGSKI